MMKMPEMNNNSSMQCEAVFTLLNEHIDGTLSPNQTTLFNLHLSSCSKCREALFQREMMVQRLNGLRINDYPQSLKNRILKQRQQIRAERARWFGAGMGLAAAVAMFAVIVTGFLYNPLQTENLHLTHDNEKEVHILLHSKKGLDDVRFLVLVPDSMGIKGFGSKKEIAWTGTLKKGENILSLPLIRHSEKSQTVVVRIEHQDSTKEYHIQLAAG